ncbi:MAG: hypothetical protein OXG50_14120, partial [bacterium]|nr:hypothetical protein [bacterium]
MEGKMLMKKHWKVWFALFAAIALVVAACGNDGGVSPRGPAGDAPAEDAPAADDAPADDAPAADDAP